MAKKKSSASANAAEDGVEYVVVTPVRMDGELYDPGDDITPGDNARHLLEAGAIKVKEGTAKESGAKESGAAGQPAS